MPHPALHSLSDIPALYKKYTSELVELALAMQPLYHRMQTQGLGTSFGDVEGEMMYMLLREQQPDLVFEVSPNAGWSSNYLLAALTKNGKGTLHSFEIETHFFGKPTEEVLRENQCKLCNPMQQVIHVGDAREEVKKVEGSVEFLLIDSCHKDWFAQWYTEHLFPRVNGIIFMQDITFADINETASEATFVVKWLKENDITFRLVGKIEELAHKEKLRDGIPLRCTRRTNAIVLAAPYERGNADMLRKGAQDFFDEAEAAQKSGDTVAFSSALAKAYTELSMMPQRTNRHRLLLKMAALYSKAGQEGEAERCCRLALGIGIGSEMNQQHKILPELGVLFLRQQRVGFLLQTFGFVLFTPRLWFAFVGKFLTFAQSVITGK